MNDHSDPTTNELAELRAELAVLRTELESVRTAVHSPSAQLRQRPAHQTQSAAAPASDTDATSRRGLLRLAGAAAVGAAAVGFGGADRAAAGSGDNTVAGYRNIAKSSTSFVYGAGAATANSVFTSDPAVSNAIVSADGAGVSNSIGFFGSGTQWGVLGSGTLAGVASFGRDYGFHAVASAKADYRFGLTTAGTNAPKVAPTSRTDAHERGELDADANGNLWFCTASGTPGTWQAIAGPASVAPATPPPAGLFHPIGPFRVYDSRVALPFQQPMVTGATRLISIADARNLATGLPTTLGVVPAGATAISCNIGVANTQGSGFVTLNPGGDTEVRAASINWFGSGQILNNGIIVKLNATREVTAIAGGGGSTDLVVDVTGYFI